MAGAVLSIFALFGVSCAVEYNEAEAKKFVYFSQAAFCAREPIETWSCGPSCDNTEVVAGKVVFIPEGDKFKVQSFVAVLPDERCVVSFRGSVTEQNWAADFYLRLKPWPPLDTSHAAPCKDCLVHTGFASAYEELREPVHDALLKLQCSRLVVTGHSLGAAVATVAAFDLLAGRKLHVEALWTYGKPRLGNANFVRAFMQAAAIQSPSPQMWRVVHYHDPVPRLPPTMHGVYDVVHEPSEVYYTKDESSYLLCPQNGTVENHSSSCAAGFPAGRCLNLEHVTYLNVSFAFKRASKECKGKASDIIFA